MGLFSQFRNATVDRGAFILKWNSGVNAESAGVNAVEISGLTPWKTGRLPRGNSGVNPGVQFGYSDREIDASMWRNSRCVFGLNRQMPRHPRRLLTQDIAHGRFGVIYCQPETI